MLDLKNIMATKTMVTLMVMVILPHHHPHHPHQAEGFNLCQDGSLVLEGPAKSRFGYTVALWSDSQANRRLVVGAPRGKDHPKLNRPDEYQLGNIFLCDLKGQCQSDDRVPYLSSEDYSRQALDVGTAMRRHGIGFGEALSSLKQETSPLIACAPRYPRVREDHKTKKDVLESRGACFVLQNDQTTPSVIVPNKTPFPKYKTVQNAAMGFSTALINETIPTVVIGGPAAFNGIGAIVNKPIDESSRGATNRIDTNEKSDKIFRDANEGWQVAQGKFDGEKTSIVTSAVNFGMYQGKIKFYSKDVEPTFRTSNNYLKEINGAEFGAKFGYSLGVGDFDGDGVDDLLVGSPWATIRKPRYLPDAGKVFIYYKPLLENKEGEEIPGSDGWGRFGLTAAGLGDINRDGYHDAAVSAPYAGSEGRGIVYIFNGSPSGLIPKPTQILHASDFSSELRGFGFSLDGGLDMDNNGYPDVLVGSVESDKALFLRSAPVVTLVGSVSFLRDALKVDNKSCDLEEAGYKKVKGVCFYLNLKFQYKSLKMTEPIDMEFRMVLQDQADHAQYLFKVTNSLTYTRSIKVRHVSDKLISIGEVIFAKSDRSVIGKPVKVSVSAHLPKPEAAEAAPDGPIDDLGLPPLAPVLDVLNQTTFQTSVILTCDNNKTCFSKPDMAISAFPTTLEVGQGRFGLPVLLEVRNDPAYEIEVTVNHPAPLMYHRVESEDFIPECLYSRLVGISSPTKFICRFPLVKANDKINFTLFFDYKPLEVMTYMERDLPGKQHLVINLKVHSDSTDTDERDNRFDSQVEVSATAILYTEAESLPETKAVKVNETLSQEEIQKVFPPYNHTFPPHRLGPKISQKFSLTNRGPSPVKGAKLKLQLALFRGAKRRVLYLLGEPQMSEGITCDWPVINPWKLQDSEGNSTDALQGTKKVRRRRQTKRDPQLDLRDTTTHSADSDAAVDTENTLWTSDQPDYTSDPRDEPSSSRVARSFFSPKGVKYIDCNLQECEVKCEVSLLNVRETASVKIWGHLVIATLDQQGHRKVGVRSWVSAEVNQRGTNVINPESPATTYVTLFKPPESGLSAVPFKLLLLAVVGSILFILLIMVVLWKAGFFKRTRPPTAPNRKSLVNQDHPPSQRGLEDMDDMPLN